MPRKAASYRLQQQTTVHILALARQTTIKSCTKALSKGCTTQNWTILLSITSSDSWVYVSLSNPPPLVKKTRQWKSWKQCLHNIYFKKWLIYIVTPTKLLICRPSLSNNLPILECSSVKYYRSESTRRVHSAQGNEMCFAGRLQCRVWQRFCMNDPISREVCKPSRKWAASLPQH